MDATTADDLPVTNIPGQFPVVGDASSTAAISASEQESDTRLYIPDAEHWQAAVKYDSEKVYCYQKAPGQDYFHLIVMGELYLISGNEKLCLKCAVQRGVATRDRLFWQHRVKRVRTPSL